MECVLCYLIFKFQSTCPMFTAGIRNLELGINNLTVNHSHFTRHQKHSGTKSGISRRSSTCPANRENLLLKLLIRNNLHFETGSVFRS